MKEKDRMHGFTVTRIRDIAEIEGRLVEMEHDRTGARLRRGRARGDGF